MRWTRIVFAALTVTALSSCRSGSSAAAAEPAPVLRTYDVPAGYGADIRSILNHAMDNGENAPRTARIELSPNGKLIVVGPPGIQDGVKDLLDQLAKAPPEQLPPTIGFTYWLVIGKKAKDAGAVPPELSELSPALAAIQKADGPVTFVAYEKMSLLSQSDESAEQWSGKRSYARQHATLHEGKIIADLDLKTGTQNSLQTRVQVAPGQLLVLGQSGWSGQNPNANPGAVSDDTLYWIARADVKTAP
jgi:hypothetical protein